MKPKAFLRALKYLVIDYSGSETFGIDFVEMVSLDCIVIKNCRVYHLSEDTFWYLQGINVSGINMSGFQTYKHIDISINPELKDVTSIFTLCHWNKTKQDP